MKGAVYQERLITCPKGQVMSSEIRTEIGSPRQGGREWLGTNQLGFLALREVKSLSQCQIFGSVSNLLVSVKSFGQWSADHLVRIKQMEDRK